MKRLEGTVMTSDKPAPAPEQPVIWDSVADVWIDVSCYLCRRYSSLQAKDINDFILFRLNAPERKNWHVIEMAGGRSVLICGKCPGSKKLEKKGETEIEENL